MKKETVLVIGASGTVGQVITKNLRALGRTVKTATSREASDKDSVQIDLLSGDGIQKAFEGVDKAFFLSPPGYADQYKVLAPLIQEAKRRRLAKVVLMTAMGVDAAPASPFRRAEIELERSGLAYTILRPNWFMQNFHTYWLEGIRAQGKILLPVGNASVSFIDARDIAAVATKALTETKLDGEALDLTGDESLTHEQVAEKLSRITGRVIQYKEIHAADMLASLANAGLPKDYAEFLVQILAALKAGFASRKTTVVSSVLGRPAASFDQYAQEHKQAWL